MFYSEITAVCSEIRAEHLNTLCGQNVEFIYFKPDGTYINHLALNGLIISEIEKNMSYQLRDLSCDCGKSDIRLSWVVIFSIF